MVCSSCSSSSSSSGGGGGGGSSNCRIFIGLFVLKIIIQLRKASVNA